MPIEFETQEKCANCGTEKSYRVQRTIRFPNQLRRYKKCTRCGHKKVLVLTSGPG